MIKLYVHNSMDDQYIIMGIERNRPIISDCFRGRVQLQDNLTYLIEEFQRKGKTVIVIGLESIELI